MWAELAVRAGLEVAIAVAIAAPLLALAFWRTPAPRWLPVAALVGLFALDEIVLILPRIGALAALQWNWQGKVLEVAWVLALVFAGAFTAREIGMATLPRRGSGRAIAACCVLMVALPLTFFVAFGAREEPNAESFLFQATMPGLAEELVYRGVFLALCDRAFGRPWKVLGASVGWGVPLTALLFGVVHAVHVARSGDIHFDVVSGAGPLIGAVVGGWLRARTDSIWPLVLMHNASNLVIPLATALVA